MSDITGLKRLMKKLDNYPTTFLKMKDELTERYAYVLLASVQRHASGRPGPNVITGAYRSSWHVSQAAEGTWKVLTDHPAARRLEYGFFGTDSLGRTYHQPPFPHVRPATMEVRQQYRSEVRKLILIAWKAA